MSAITPGSEISCRRSPRRTINARGDHTPCASCAPCTPCATRPPARRCRRALLDRGVPARAACDRVCVRGPGRSANSLACPQQRRGGCVSAERARAVRARAVRDRAVRAHVRARAVRVRVANAAGACRWMCGLALDCSGPHIITITAMTTLRCAATWLRSP